MLFKKTVFILFTLILSTSLLSAQETDVTPFQKDFLGSYYFSNKKVSDLADVIPEDLYDWRPADGVRSFKETALHIAAANYFIASMLGKDIPEGINPRELEKSEVSKAEVKEILLKSVAHMNDALSSLNPEDLETEIEAFGQKFTKRGMMIVAGNHVAEHLGQLIAYSRMNGIVPPWSQKESGE